MACLPDMSSVKFIPNLIEGMCDKLLFDKSNFSKSRTYFKDALSNRRIAFEEKFRQGDRAVLGNCPLTSSICPSVTANEHGLH